MSEVRWHVYWLIDPRDRKPFYVGYTVNPANRLKNHKYDAGQGGWARHQDLRELGLSIELEVLGIHDNENDAAWHEADLLDTMPGLVNLNSYGPLPGWRTHVRRYSPENPRKVEPPVKGGRSVH